MDLVLRGRGVRITDQLRRSADHKFARLDRIHRRVGRVEIEISEQNPRVDGGHRVTVACSAGRRTFRAEATARDVEAALDQVVQRLERQMSTYRGKLRSRLMRRGNRLQSQRTSPEESG